MLVIGYCFGGAAALELAGFQAEQGTNSFTAKTGKASRSVEFSTELVFPEASDASDYLPRLWASRKLGHLERQIWTEGETASLVESFWVGPGGGAVAGRLAGAITAASGLAVAVTVAGAAVVGHDGDRVLRRIARPLFHDRGGGRGGPGSAVSSPVARRGSPGFDPRRLR